MIAITTVAELDALPVGAVVSDEDGDKWRKKPSGFWALGGQFSSDLGVPPEHLLKIYRPLTIDAPSELRMTRCSGTDSCTTTTPLPVGAHWTCPDCGGTNNTTRGTAS